MIFKEMSDNQRRIFIDAGQIYEAYSGVYQKNRSCKGGTPRVPDPRAFSPHKIWLSEQPDREPVKKKRDRTQGLTVARLVVERLPQYPFKSSELRMFPMDLVHRVKNMIQNEGETAGFDFA